MGWKRVFTADGRALLMREGASGVPSGGWWELSASGGRSAL